MEKRRKNIPRPYSAMKRYLRIAIAVVLLSCTAMVSSAQSKSIAAVYYDAQTHELTIDRPMNLCKIICTEDMPVALRRFVGDSCKILEQDKKYVAPNITPEEMAGYDSLTVYFRNAQKMEVYDQPYRVKIDIRNLIEEEKEKETKKVPFYAKWLALGKSVIYFASGGFLLLVVLLVTLLLLRRKRKVKNDSTEESLHVMQVVEEEQNDYAVGLDYIRQHPEGYFAVDMEEFSLDTAVKKVYFSREAVKSLNSYYKAFLEQPERTNETGCYLIGGWETVDGNDEQYNISVEEMVIPGDDAVYDEYSLNFGLKIGIKLGSTIRNLCEKTGRDYVHTVWMHSHPGLGLFLSSHDLVVQKQLAYPDAPKRMVAIVIDTNTPNWQMAFFTAKNNGVMNNKEDLLKTISFDVLNEWSRHKAVMTTPSATVENSFVVSTEDTRDEFAFSAKTINQIDDAVYAEAAEESCPLYGEIRLNEEKKTRVVTACGISGDDKQIGLLVVDPDTEEAFDPHRCDESLTQVDFCLVYRSEQECYVVWQNADRKIRFLHTSLKEMKEWTRRKRV
ncbi:MAG: hypothetical protein IJK22_04430 [Bacteroidales bacterium]|nr:hypothetical protein [Bacteroidales bacterium]